MADEQPAQERVPGEVEVGELLGKARVHVVDVGDARDPAQDRAEQEFVKGMRDVVLEALISKISDAPVQP